MRARGRPRGVPLVGVVLHLLPAATLCFLFAAVGVVHVTSRVMVVDAGYRLSRLDQEGAALTLQNDKLKLELATLKSPLRLEKLAAEQLHMEPPAPGTVIHLTTAPPRLARRGPEEARRATTPMQAPVKSAHP